MVRTALLICCLFLGTADARADTRPATNKTPLTEAQIAEKMGIAPDSARFERLKSGAYLQEMENRTDAQPIVKHIRGTGGTALPKPEEIVIPIKFGDTERKVMEETLTKSFEETAKMYQTIPVIPECTSSSTEKTPTNYRDFVDRKDLEKGKTREVVFDMLIIRKHQIPLDPREAFGFKTKVRAFDEEKPNLDAVAFGRMNIPCLPFRMRATREFTIVDKGLNALMNYDKDPYKGKLHDSVSHLKNRY